MNVKMRLEKVVGIKVVRIKVAEGAQMTPPPCQTAGSFCRYFCFRPDSEAVAEGLGRHI
jgi:hypothetical protein